MKQKSARFRQPTPDEQEILIHLVVQAVPPDEAEQFDQLLAQHHYLKDARLVGQHLRYVATYRGQWLALAAWSAAALHINRLPPHDAPPDVGNGPFGSSLTCAYGI